MRHLALVLVTLAACGPQVLELEEGEPCVAGFDQGEWQLPTDFMLDLGAEGDACLTVADGHLSLTDEWDQDYGPFKADCLDHDFDGEGDGYRVAPFGRVEVTPTDDGWVLDALVFQVEQKTTTVTACELF